HTLPGRRDDPVVVRGLAGRVGDIHRVGALRAPVDLAVHEVAELVEVQVGGDERVLDGDLRLPGGRTRRQVDGLLGPVTGGQWHGVRPVRGGVALRLRV